LGKTSNEVINVKKLINQKGFLVVLLLALTTVTVIVGVLSFNNNDNSDLVDLNETTQAQVDAANNNVAKNNETTQNETIQNETTKQEESTTTEKLVSSNEITKNTETEKAAEVAASVMKFTKDSTLVWPVEGQVLLEYNMDNTIYFPTLNEYKCNPAVVIQADKGMEVKAAVAGIVKEISANEEIGNYVVMTIGDGYEITYGQLNAIKLAVGQAVEEREVIGTIAEPTKYYVTEGYNLYLNLTKDEKPIDPLDYLDYK